jgi:ribose transport system substrate-binding protein
MPIFRAGLLIALVSALAGCEPTRPPPLNSPPVIRIAVIPKGTTHEFWRAVQAGAQKAGRELGATVTFQGPEREDDRESQVSLVQNTISVRPDAIVLAPLDARALVDPVRQARAAGIPVVIIDSGLEARAGEDFVSFVATDNRKGGQMAGRRLGEALGGRGRVVILRYLEGSASTTQREEGCLQALTEFAGIEVIDPGRYAGATRATAQEAAENLLAASGSFDGVFCPNESSTYGMLLALRTRGLAGKVRFVGFDASDAAIEAVRAGEVEGLVLQNPVRMGYLGVKAAIDHLRGGVVEPEIDTGALLLTRDNLDSPEARELLAPPPAAGK